jgi:hypothetical protein
MTDSSNVARTIRERLGAGTEDRFGKALTDLLENPLLTGAISRAFDAREKAAAAQEVAMGALNLPSAADIERLTRRLRAVSHRLEGIEDGVDRLDRSLAPSAVEGRLAAIEAQLQGLSQRVDRLLEGSPKPAATESKAATAAKPKAARAAKPKAATAAKPKAATAAKPKAARAAKPKAAKRKAPAKPKAG